MTRIASLYGRVIVALRWPIVVAWVAATVAATVALPTIEEAQNGALGDLVPNHAAALDAEMRSARLFGFPLLSRTVVVQRDGQGLSARAQTRTVGRAVDITRGRSSFGRRISAAIPLVNTVAVPPLTRERGTTALTYLYFTPSVGAPDRVARAETVARDAAAVAPRAFTGVTGAVPAREEQFRRITGRLPLVEVLTVLLVVLAIGVHYRALLAPVLALCAIAVSYLVTIRVVAWLGVRLGIAVPSEVQPVVVVLIFGILTDYAIFYLSRFRSHLAADRAPVEAARRTAGELVGTILSAGITVAGASASLIVAHLGFLQAFGPGLALAVLIALAVALTLVPALLAIGGARIFWPAGPGPDLSAAVRPREARPRRARSWAVGLATRHPALTVIACGGLLLGAASGLLRLHVGQTLIRGLPSGGEVHRAYSEAARGFAPGIIAPTVVILEDRDIADRGHAVRRLQREIARQAGVAFVAGPRQQPLTKRFGAVYSPSGDAVRYAVIFDADPIGSRAIADLRRLRRRLAALTQRAGLGRARVSIAGDTALAEETVRLTGDDLARVAPVAVFVVFLVLAIFLRALLAPLYLVLASVLALAAAIGASVYLFQVVLGHGEMTYYVPFVAAVMLVALGSDYNVFLAGRIWHEAGGRPFREAIAVGGSRAAAAITVAGIVLALSFGLLAFVPVRAFRELAFTMGFGLLLDAFLVRTLLAPALTALFGPRAAWPRTVSGSPGVAGPEAVRARPARP